MIDFTKCEQLKRGYAGANGNKISVRYNGDIYMLKFPSGGKVNMAVEPERLRAFFWDMFVVDALIGNWDRHNGNWGFLYNQATDEMRIAPVYDCGSSLYPQADEEIMKLVHLNSSVV